MSLANVITLLVFGLGLLVLGLYGRRHAESLGKVPGMAAEQEQRRISTMRRGATTCAFVGAVFVLVGVIGPLLPVQQQ